ncbi:MAG: S8 family serine peptidase [Bacteroidota bacterium]
MIRHLKHIKLVLPIALLSISTAFGQTESQKQQIIDGYDQNKLSELQQQFAAKSAVSKQKALQMATQKGWEVIKQNEDGTFDELMGVSKAGEPIYYTIYNVAAARSTRANHLHTGGTLGLNVDGQNMTAHVWDGGPTRPTHQEFDGPGGNNRVVINDGVTSLNGNSFHAQHVTGTIVASGVQANAKGMAWQARALTHDWNNDLAEATNAAANGMLISNHSYGFRATLIPDWWFGAYIDDSRDWDQLMYNSPFYLMVNSAGNDGNNNTANAQPLNGSSAFDKLNGTATAKNNLVIANAQDANVAADGTLNSVAINSSSSEGPTDDLRIKPDLAGNGTGVYSTYDNSDAAYNSISGTSMASPNVAGTLLLLQQHYNDLNGNFMRAATLKGLALHTADDAGITGPDAVWGWGLLNAKVAAQAISQNGAESIVDELTLTPGQTYTITVDADGSVPLMASISWTDPAGTVNPGTANLTTPVLVNDLDIRVTQGGSTFLPYRLTGVNSNTLADNNVDPFERITVGSASGSYTITVTHKGSLTNGSQNYSLIVTGLTGQPVVCNATTPTGLGTSSVGATSAGLSWNAVAGATYDVRYRAVGSSGWTTTAVSGTSTTISGLSQSTQYEAQVRSRCPDNSTSGYSSSVTFTTSSSACTGGITAYPYSESFEGNIGAWEQSSADDLNWTVNSGGTPSNGTGPTAATDGSSYIYVEVSGNGTGYPNKRAILTSPCFDLTGESQASLSFDYHMTGNAVGTFDVEASDDNGATWTTVWTRSGDQGANWNAGDVNLNAYAGATLKLRLNAVSGSSWQGDIAVDNVVVSSGAAGDTQAPTIPTGLAASNVTETTLTLTWNASTDNVGVTGYDVYEGGSNLGTVTSTTANITGLVASTSYSFTVVAKDAAGNESAQSSALSVTTSSPPGSGCSGGITGFPYSEGFEGTLGAWSNVGGDDLNWTVNSDGTPSSGTGPSSATEGTSYIYVEVSGNGTGYPTKRAYLNSPCFDLSGLSSAYFNFSYHMFGSTAMGSLDVEASDDDGATWTSVWNLSGNQGDSWQSVSIDLSSYTGGSIQLRLNTLSGTTWQGDIAVDDVSLTSTPPTTDICAGVQPWSSTQTYSAGDQVTYQGSLYEWTGSSWINLGTCGTTNALSFATTASANGPLDFVLYPNPARGGDITIATSRTDVSYQITNLMGQEIDRGRLVNNKINVDDFGAGVYVIKLYSGEENMVLRFVVE